MVDRADEEPRGWDLAEGETIGNGLTALRHLGTSNTHEVYLAWDEERYTPLAAKLLLPHRVEDARARADLRAEGELLRALDHPVLPRCFRIDVDGERPHIGIEYVDGPRLSTVIRRQARLAVEQAVPLLQQVSAALHYLAGRGLVHLDVKPKNVIMSPPPRLIDLSVARTIGDARRTTRPIGTDPYMAPEQTGTGLAHEIGPETDVWGLGVSLYESLTGTRPFPPGDPGGTPEERFPQLRAEPADLPKDVPADLADLIHATLRKRPQDRPTAREVADALDPVIEHAPRKLLLGKLRVSTWRPGHS
ncbi:MAG TPA: serine/threonine-protein kinase [Actinomycetota bacterium]